MNIFKSVSIGILLVMGATYSMMAQNFEYNTIQIKSVMFGGDTLVVRKDGLTLGYNGYHWSPTPGIKKPAAYVSNKAPKVTAEFEWTCTSAPDSVYIKGLAAAGSMEFPSVKVAVQTVGSSKKIIYPMTFATSVFEAGKAQYFPEYDIQWQISYDGIDWNTIGETTTELFVTKNNPMAETGNYKHWHTVYYLSCKNAHGYSTESDIIQHLFEEFEDQMVLNHNNDTLFYYRNMATGNVNLASLLLNKDAQCFTFAQLFLAMVKIQGIVRTNNYINITPIGNMVCGGKSVNRFIVKNWSPTGLMTSSCSSFPYKNTYLGSLFNPTFTAYDFSYTEIQDDDGAPGPGNSNPSSYFNNHQIALIDGMYYDACYGVKYSTLEEYTSNSIEGWSYRVTVGSTNDCFFTTDLSLSSFSQSISTF